MIGVPALGYAYGVTENGFAEMAASASQVFGGDEYGHALMIMKWDAYLAKAS